MHEYALISTTSYYLLVFFSAKDVRSYIRGTNSHPWVIAGSGHGRRVSGLQWSSTDDRAWLHDKKSSGLPPQRIRL